jgi:hypothetical protein
MKRLLLTIITAALIGAPIWLLIGSEVRELGQAAWWELLVLLIVPALMDALYVRDRSVGR